MISIFLKFTEISSLVKILVKFFEKSQIWSN